jgi:hypothetical protein
MEILTHLQWPAMVLSLVAAWLVAAQSKSRRRYGFWVFLLSNVLWVGWGWHAKAWALVALQAGLALLNCRSVDKNSPT